MGMRRQSFPRPVRPIPVGRDALGVARAASTATMFPGVGAVTAVPGVAGVGGPAVAAAADTVHVLHAARPTRGCGAHRPANRTHTDCSHSNRKPITT